MFHCFAPLQCANDGCYKVQLREVSERYHKTSVEPAIGCGVANWRMKHFISHRHLCENMWTVVFQMPVAGDWQLFFRQLWFDVGKGKKGLAQCFSDAKAVSLDSHFMCLTYSKCFSPHLTFLSLRSSFLPSPYLFHHIYSLKSAPFLRSRSVS